MRTALLALLATLTLAACADDSSAVAAIQRGYPLLATAIALYEIEDHPQPAVVAAIARAEAIAAPVVAALGSTQSPATAEQALADIQTLLAAIPPGSVSPRTALALQDAELVLGVAETR